MAQHSRGPRVVIVGLGVVGAAVADELVLRGWTDVTVVEQGPLFETGGSSSHAPGFVFQTSPNRAMTQLAQRTLRKLDGLSVNGEWVSKRVGGIELATTEERLRELRRRQGFAQSWGVPAQLIPPEQIAALWPGLDTTGLLGGLHTPTDAVVKGVRAVEFQARRAEAGGATLLPWTRVSAVNTSGSQVTGVQICPVDVEGSGVDTSETLPADVVLLCAGLWGPGMARDQLGLELPMLPVEHGFGFSLPVSTGVDAATEVVKPMLRHQDCAMYLREWGDRIAVGAYEHRPLPVTPDQIAAAEDFARTGIHPAVHPFTAEDFAPTWAEAQRLLPQLARGGEGAAGLDAARSFNGIFSFTPDGGPLLGPVPGTAGLWMAQSVWVTQSAGVGEVMADWMTTGDPGIDTHGLDLGRFDPAVVSSRWAQEQGEESYDEVYDIIHPKATTLRMRGLRTSAFHPRQQELGAVFESAAGWERPLWFESNQGLGEARLGDQPLPDRDAWSGRHWSPIAAREARHLREHVGLVDMSSLSRLQLHSTGHSTAVGTQPCTAVGTQPCTAVDADADPEGHGATAFLLDLHARGLLSRRPSRTVGGIVYALLLDERGRVLSDITLARTGPQSYHLGINGPLDTAWLRARIAEHQPAAGETLQLTDAGTGACGLGLWGPQARTVLQKLVAEDLSDEDFKFYRARQLRVAGVPVLALRLSYVGELGWELYAPAEFGRFLWDALMDAGQAQQIRPVGRRAFESLRLEKGFRLWGTDMTREHTPVEAGVDFAVTGEAAKKLAALGADVPRRRLQCLVLEDPAQVLLGHEPVFAPGGTDPLGYVTSADQGYTVGESIAYAWLEGSAQGAARSIGDPVEIACFGERLPAVVAAEPRFDPGSTRMRG
ncbi:FAD-dependent oxidoreductase [Nesterenkonia sp. AY15]|uniref:GcvT family protein n=1 Tax=Nesterenkonia sp. AY15 TaxID=2901139 RepID=UPI001F4C54A2|nr:FAD-dependent oxidoreductase [Nesterenkonia sp. AY15]MCH8571935.1 FAD-dependent oxidoreductase [Nesterenkonia sp. AY15]